MKANLCILTDIGCCAKLLRGNGDGFYVRDWPEIDQSVDMPGDPWD